MGTDKKVVGGLEDTESGYDHGKGSSVLAAYFNVVCVTAGIGILTLPASLAKGGWLSAIFIAVAGVMAVFSSTLLIECKYARSDEVLHSFPEIGGAAFGNVGRYLIQTCHYLILLGSGCLLILVVGLVGNKLALQLGVELSDKHFVMIAGLVVMVPLCALRRIKEFVWMAIFGFMTTLVTLLVVCTLSIVVIPSAPAPETALIKLNNLPSVCAVFSLAYAGNMIHPHVEGSMEEPKRWPVALSLGLGTVFLFYITMALTGYAVFGEGSKTFLFDNLDDYPVAIPNNIARVLIVGHILLTAPLILCSFSTEVEPLLKITPPHMSNTRATVFRVALRAGVTAALTLVAAYLPHTMELMGVIGSLFMVINLYIVPVICHLKLFGLGNRSLVQWFLITLTLIFSGITFVAGGYDNIAELVNAVNATSS
ncbi:hypothetical protein L0F63_001026 [Massospora cicadina]|nr:hypothetical protein L0F63_001026 [Massospora cicadina]